MIYIASPYSSLDSSCPLSRQEINYQEALHVSAVLTSRGKLVISPVVLGHKIDLHIHLGSLPRPPYQWWAMWSLELLECCDSLYVLTIEGWEDSRGIQNEIAFARSTDMPISFIDREANLVPVPEGY